MQAGYALFGALLFALNSKSTMYEMVQNAYNVTLAGAFVPLLAGAYWKRATTQGALLSIVLVFAVAPRALSVVDDAGHWVQQPGATSTSDFQPLLEEVAARTGLSISLDGIYRWVVFLPSRVDERVPVANRYFGVFQEQLKTAQARVPHPKWGDMDNDGVGNNTDTDDDNDGVDDVSDAFPLDASETADTDGDGQVDDNLPVQGVFGQIAGVDETLQQVNRGNPDDGR